MMNVTPIVISKDKEKLDVKVIYEFLTSSYWAKGRTYRDVQDSINNSTCYGVYKDEKLIGFARIITDTVVFAYIMDVFFIEAERGNGYALKLMEYILADESLKRVTQWYLKTKDAHQFYSKLGFNKLKNQEWFMEILK